MRAKLSFKDPAGKLLSSIEVSKLPLKFGRAPENDVILNHPSVSRYHCRIEERAGRLWMVDQDSVNGLKVSGKKIKDLELDLNPQFLLGEIAVTYEPALLESPLNAASAKTQVAATEEANDGSEERTAIFSKKNQAGRASSASHRELAAEVDDLFSAKTIIRRKEPEAPAKSQAPRFVPPASIASASAFNSPMEVTKTNFTLSDVNAKAGETAADSGAIASASVAGHKVGLSSLKFSMPSFNLSLSGEQKTKILKAASLVLVLGFFAFAFSKMDFTFFKSSGGPQALGLDHGNWEKGLSQAEHGPEQLREQLGQVIDQSLSKN